MTGVFADLAGQDAVVAQLAKAAAAASALLAGERPAGGDRGIVPRQQAGRDDARVAVHRAARVGTFGRRAGVRGGPALPVRRLRRVRVLPSGAGGHPRDLLLVRPEGLSYGVKQTRDLVLRAAGAPTGGRWQVVLFEDADRCTEQAANALLKAIEEPAPRTVWLLCAPSAEDLVPTIRSRCRVVTLVVPASSAVAKVLIERDGIDPAPALAAARAAQGHVGRARRLAAGSLGRGAARRRAARPGRGRLARPGPAAAAARWCGPPRRKPRRSPRGWTSPERDSLRKAFGEGSTGKGVAKAMRGMAGAMKDLEDRQKSRATRVKRDTLDQALLDLAVFYRDVLMVQLGADVELANADRDADLRRIAAASSPEATLRRMQAIMRCRERLTLNVAPLLAVEEMTLSLVHG